MTALAAKGVKLTHYYSQPSCSPSRVAMMTGKFPYKNGFQNYELQLSDQVGVPLSNKLMPSHMKDLGYQTAMLGKWNIGHCNSKYLPHERGFDSFLGYMCPGHGYTDFNCGMGSGVKDMLQGSAILKADGSGEVEYQWQTGAEYEGTYDTKLYRDKAGAVVRAHARANKALPAAAAAAGSASSSMTATTSSTATKSDASSASHPNATPLFMWCAHHGIHAEHDSDPIPPSDMLSEANLAYLKVTTNKRGEGNFLATRQIILVFFFTSPHRKLSHVFRENRCSFLPLFSVQFLSCSCCDPFCAAQISRCSTRR